MRLRLGAAARIFTVVCVVSILQLPSAWAAPPSVGDYYSLGDDNGQSAIYIDRKFVIPHGDGRKIARLTTVYATPQAMQGLATPFVIMNIGMEFDCDQPRDQQVGLTFFDAAGNKLYEEPIDLVWSPISQGSPAERMRAWACGLAAWPAASFAKGTLSDLRAAYLRSARGARPERP